MDSRTPPKAAPRGKPKKVAKRTPGRPLRDAQDLRPKLLDAAVVCYVRDGMAGTSLRAIATEAGVTPALLHYYFGDKAQLQEAFVQERMLPAFGVMREGVQRA